MAFRKPNRELAVRALNHIQANPENWNQARWHCRTSHCIAGWVDILAGYWDAENERCTPKGKKLMRQLRAQGFLFGAAEEEATQFRALHALRLNTSVLLGTDIFYCRVKFKTLYELVSLLAEGRIDSNGDIVGPKRDLTKPIEVKGRA